MALAGSASTHDRPDDTPGAPRSRRALVTGGAGFVGSHLVRLLLNRGDRVTIIDNLSTGRRANMPPPHDRLRFIEADLSHALGALGAGEKFDEVYHLAAAVGVKLVVDDPIGCIETNILGTIDVLKFAMSHGVHPAGAPILIASSSEVYGKADKTPFSEDDDVVYGPTTRSRWSYAASKAVDEYLALAHHAKHNLPVVIVRLFNTVGPRQVGSYGMVLPNFVAAALESRDLHIFGDGRQTRCFCDVRDVVGAMPRLLANPTCIGRVFNLGGNRSLTIQQLADTVIATLNSTSKTRFVHYEKAYSPGFEDLMRREPDLRRIREAIGFEQTISLEQTIRDIASDMREHAALASASSSAGRDT